MFDLTPQTVSEFVEWDDEVIGLGKRLRTSSAPRWIVQTRVEGKSRKRVLGDADAISLIDARLAAIISTPILAPVPTAPIRPPRF